MRNPHDGRRRADSRRKWRAFLGGFLILFGARLADGCTSGHVITGMTQWRRRAFCLQRPSLPGDPGGEMV